ncbi:beta-carboxysome assembly chaperone CcmS [Oscillatoria salina]|uniref:beta-carboxysome assembly chaperone CcmS n=1 Tax=Oscillatoria salina TaxID=331517 RepID=UPI0013B5B786|nr:hypothetical protein [Oscillatoria salina]MBZ8180712.1 hypothetical protein [Oscillatoria salina IIICB1]NET87578.1 hypothetical protein [Kamptonema sp. SIO1D9]
MFGINKSSPPRNQNDWQYQLDKFVKSHQQELAALAWGLSQEQGETTDTLGIDIKPTPHFVCCPKTAIETLNQNANNHLQEILGLVEGYQPEVEVLMIGIGEGEIKLIYFQPETPPPQCFEQLGQNTNSLLTNLEEQMKQELKI